MLPLVCQHRCHLNSFYLGAQEEPARSGTGVAPALSGPRGQGQQGLVPPKSGFTAAPQEGPSVRPEWVSHLGGAGHVITHS